MPVLNLSQETGNVEVFAVFLNLSRKMHGYYQELPITTSTHLFGDSLLLIASVNRQSHSVYLQVQHWYTVVGLLNSVQFEAQVTTGRIEYKKGGYSSDPCILTTLKALCSLCIHASRGTLKKVQYPAERYVLKVIWLHEMMTQVPDP